jgi:ribosome-associated protein
VPDPIDVAPHVRVPASALSMRAVRAAGPGGQNVNKVASKVELRVDLARIEGLSAAARGRLLALCAGRRASDGRLVVRSQRSRDQHRNLEDARERVRQLVVLSLKEPRLRRPTRPARAARERRLVEKRQAGDRKRARRRASGEGED